MQNICLVASQIRSHPPTDGESKGALMQTAPTQSQIHTNIYILLCEMYNCEKGQIVIPVRNTTEDQRSLTFKLFSSLSHLISVVYVDERLPEFNCSHRINFLKMYF